MKSLVAFLSNQNAPEMAEVLAELNAELAKGEAKAQANRELYAAAHDAVIKVMSDVPMTVTDIYEKAKNELPEGFTKAKVQYALLNYWESEVVKIDNGKRSVKTYRRA